MSINAKSPQAARKRLLVTARRLFVEKGVPNTGINQVIDEAGVARMTLYNHFPSKDDLVAAVFEEEAAQRRATILSTQKLLDGPFEKVMALFTVALDLAGYEGFRGCAFLNLAIETAAPDSALHAVARNHKDWILRNIADSLPDELFDRPQDLARQVLVLWDGGVVSAWCSQD